MCVLGEGWGGGLLRVGLEGSHPTTLLQTRFISDSNRFDPLRLTAAINKSVTMYSPYLPRGRTGLMGGTDGGG